MKDFDKIIWRDALTLVDFYATWCAPCKAMNPTIERLRSEFRGRIEIYQINIDSAEDALITARYNIIAVPTLLFFRRGEVLWRGSGQMSYEQLRSILERLEIREHVTP